MKKTIILLIIILFVFTSVQIAAQPQITQPYFNNWPITQQQPPKPTNDEIDQQQTIMNFAMPIGNSPLVPKNVTIAQSFIPTKKILTRVELLIGKNSTVTYPYHLALRENVTQPDIAKITIPPEQVVTENFSWAIFDFGSVPLTPGSTYFLVSYTTNIPDNYYAWGLSIGDTYPHGLAAASLDNGSTWDYDSSIDMCFITYGTNDSPPTIELINPKLGYFHFSGIPLIPTSLDLLADTASFGGFRLGPIEVNTTDDIDNTADLKVTVYLNDEEKGNASYNTQTDTYQWRWTGLALGVYTLKITVEDSGSNQNSVEAEVWNFCFIP